MGPLGTRRRLESLCLLALAACNGDEGAAGLDASVGDRPDGGPGPAGCTPRPGEGTAEPAPIAWQRDLGTEGAVRLSFDGEGDIIVTLKGLEPEEDLFCAGLAKLAPDGTEIWRRTYDLSQPPGESFAVCPALWTALAVDVDGSIVTIGGVSELAESTSGARGVYQGRGIALRKHDGDGQALWTYYHDNGPGSRTELGRDVALDRGGDIIAAGDVQEGTPWLAKLDTDGVLRWMRLGEELGSVSEVETLAGDEIVAATERYADESGGMVPTTIDRIDPEGLATTMLAGTATPAAVAVDSDGAVVIASWGAIDAGALRKVSSSGTVLWERELRLPLVDGEGCSIRDGDGFRLATGPDRSIYVGSNVHPDSGSPDFPISRSVIMVTRYSPEGTILWSNLYAPEAESALFDLKVAPDGAVVVTGEMIDTGPGSFVAALADPAPE